jgi:hypothetical protein
MQPTGTLPRGGFEQRQVKGFLFDAVSRSQSDPDEVWLIVGFEDEASYRANAEDPQTDPWTMAGVAGGSRLPLRNSRGSSRDTGRATSSRYDSVVGRPEKGNGHCRGPTAETENQPYR